MKYQLPNDKTGYRPEVVSFLDALPDENLHHDNYDLMHPIDTFTSILDEVIESGIVLTKSLLKIIETEVYKSPNDDLSKIIRINIKAFLFSLADFIDGCQSILKSMYEKSTKQHKKENSEFIKNIRSYKNKVGKIVNYIKHRHRVIRVIYGRWDNQIIVGYYIEGVVDKGITGPDPDIHTGSNCAISLNRDIPYHICNIYYLSSVLKYILNKKNKNDNINIKCISDNQDKKILVLLQLIAKVPKNYFPDEVKKPVPDIRLKNKNKQAFELSFPSKYSALNKRPHNFRLSLATTVRSKSPVMKMPYFGEDTIKEANK